MGFDYLEPATIEEAVSLLSKYNGKAKVIAGGTDLMVQVMNKRVKPEYVVDIEHIPGLDYIKYDEKQGLRIGTLTTIEALKKSAELRQRYPIISQAASQFGSRAIRNVATVGGNLCNAAPTANTAQPLIALSARVKIVGPSGERVVPLEDFFISVGSTILERGELLVEIQVPVPPHNTRGVYLKHSVRGIIDLPIVSVAVVSTLEPESGVCRDIRIVLGSVAPTPMRARKAEEIMKGRKVDEASINRSAEVASHEAHPRPSSIRASAQYKKEMIGVLTRRALREVAGK